MRILHLISSGGLFGAERVVLTLAAQKDENSYWVGALNNWHNPHLEIIEQAQSQGLKTAVFDSKGQLDLGTIVAVRKFIQDNQIDILHTHNYKSDFIGFWATRLTATRWVATNHVWSVIDQKMRFYEILDMFFLKFARKVFTVSQEIKDGMMRHGFKEAQLQVIPNGISLDQFHVSIDRQAFRAQWKITAQDVLLGVVGRLAPEKGHEIFLQAFTQVIGQNPHVKALIVGDGPLKEVLQAKVRVMKLEDHVIFAGIRKDMPAIYASCDMLVNASYVEGMPMTVLEAMASHLPVIATRVGGTPQVIEPPRNGLLVDAGDVRGLASAIEAFLNDPKQRQACADAAYKDVVSRFSDRTMAENYQRFYAQCLQ